MLRRVLVRSILHQTIVPTVLARWFHCIQLDTILILTRLTWLSCSRMRFSFAIWILQITRSAFDFFLRHCLHPAQWTERSIDWACCFDGETVNVVNHIKLTWPAAEQPMPRQPYWHLQHPRALIANCLIDQQSAAIRIISIITLWPYINIRTAR